MEHRQLLDIGAGGDDVVSMARDRDTLKKEVVQLRQGQEYLVRQLADMQMRQLRAEHQMRMLVDVLQKTVGDNPQVQLLLSTLHPPKPMLANEPYGEAATGHQGGQQQKKRRKGGVELVEEVSPTGQGRAAAAGVGTSSPYYDVAVRSLGGMNLSGETAAAAAAAGEGFDIQEMDDAGECSSAVGELAIARAYANVPPLPSTETLMMPAVQPAAAATYWSAGPAATSTAVLATGTGSRPMATVTAMPSATAAAHQSSGPVVSMPDEPLLDPLHDPLAFDLTELPDLGDLSSLISPAGAGGQMTLPLH